MWKFVGGGLAALSYFALIVLIARPRYSVSAPRFGPKFKQPLIPYGHSHRTVVPEISANLAGYRPSISSVAIKPITPMRSYQNQIELLQGTLDLLILQTLQWGPQHGYSIARSINITSGDVLEVDAGSLYPALHRLERQGRVKSRWKQSENQQRVKEYRLTNSGKKQLLSERSRWEKLAAAIAGVLKPQED